MISRSRRRPRRTAAAPVRHSLARCHTASIARSRPTGAPTASLRGVPSHPHPQPRPSPSPLRLSSPSSAAMSTTNKKTQITIKPYRPVQMDPHYADNTWKLLKHAIHEIHKKNASGLSFEELYR